MSFAISIPEDMHPQLPAAYELFFFDQLESLRAKAKEIADQGAEEGSLIWTLNQTDALARLDKKWICNSGDLHCSLILRPEFESKRYYQMLIVALISLGNSIASYVSPMTALGYQWPNDISIADHKVASIWLDQGQSSDAHWLAITLSTNITHSPQYQTIKSMSILEAEGTTELTNVMLLESFAREFITQINNWSVREFNYIYDQWRMRLESVDQYVELQTQGKTYTGIVKGINHCGDLELIGEDCICQTLTIHDHMELSR